MMIHEMAHMMSDDPRDPIGILVISSLLRDDLPWLYEIGTEVYRTAKTGDPKAAERALIRFQRAAEFTTHTPFFEELVMSSKEMHMMLRELPMLIEKLVEGCVRRRKRPPSEREQ